MGQTQDLRAEEMKEWIYRDGTTRGRAGLGQRRNQTLSFDALFEMPIRHSLVKLDLWIYKVDLWVWSLVERSKLEVWHGESLAHEWVLKQWEGMSSSRKRTNREERFEDWPQDISIFEVQKTRRIPKGDLRSSVSVTGGEHRSQEKKCFWAKGLINYIKCHCCGRKGKSPTGSVSISGTLIGAPMQERAGKPNQAPHQGNATQNHREIAPHTCQTGSCQKVKK